MARPVKELKGFDRVLIPAGQTKTVTLKVNEESLSYFDNDGRRVFEPGDFELMVGPNSRDLQTKKITVE